jgi:hypothetical protein
MILDRLNSKAVLPVLVFLISGDLPVMPVDGLLVLAVEKGFIPPCFALLVDNTPWQLLVTHCWCVCCAACTLPGEQAGCVCVLSAWYLACAWL